MKARKHWGKWVGIAVAAALAASAGGYLWFFGNPAEAESAQAVVASRSALTASISPTGEVQPVHRLNLGFDVDRVALVEVYVAAGQQVAAGEPLARVDEEPLRRALDQAEADALSLAQALEQASNPYTELDRGAAALAVAKAEVTLAEARQALADLQTVDVSDARTAVAQAQYSLDSALLNLSITEHSSEVGKAVRDLEYAVSWHERALRDLQAKRERGETDQATVDAETAALGDLQIQLTIAHSTSTVSLAEAEDRVAEARAALSEAQEELAELQRGEGALARVLAEQRVAQAELDLVQAQERLATASAGPNEGDILLAQARYEAALATLQEARETLDHATLLAPFDGTVVAVAAEAGDQLTASSTVLTFADLSNLRVLVAVDETDISQVAAGQTATITFDALPGQRFSGEVLEVPLEGALASNVVTYQVPISLEGAEHASLLPGMTANVTIITGRSQDALLLPILAVQQDDQGYYVLVEDGAGSSATARVEVGLGNGQYVEITRGLLEGDRVLVQLQEDASSQIQFVGRGSATGGLAVPLGRTGR